MRLGTRCRRASDSLGPPCTPDFDLFRMAGDKHYLIHENPRRVHILGRHATQRNELIHFRGYELRGRRHRDIEIAHSHSITQIAQPVAAVSTDERKVRMQRLFEDIFAAIDYASLFAGCEFGSRAGRSEKAAKA